ncbi:flippase [uncultured Desulfobacter sp.]|uniref:flippase n=1 Tax=uncultured Desulfobacter sp. TaxID=240139 RepID=UPI002AAAD3AE|nr:flippase [uncultured Desulfobacter sp.]
MIRFIKKKYHNLVSDQKFTEILTGSVWALSARVIATALGLAFSVIVARLYGADVVGILAVINSFLMLATIFTVLGTPTSILRLIPEHLAKYSPTSAFKVYRKTQYMVIGISLVTGAVFYFGANLIADKVFSKPHLSYYFALASVFIVFQSIMQLNTEAVRGLRLIKLFALMQLLPQTFNLIFLISVGLFWPAKDGPVYAVLFGFATTGIIGWFIMEFAFKKRMQPADNVSHMTGSAILSISLPMLMTATMAFLIGQTGVLMLGMFRSEAEVGYYAIAVKLAYLTSFVLNAVNSMAGPKFSDLFYTHKMDELFHVAKKSAKLIFVTTTPILLCLMIFGKSILGKIFGQEFAIAYPALMLLVMGQFVNSVAGSSGTFLNMTGNQKIFRNIMIIAAGLNIGLNLWLIPSLGINGAAFTAMISLCFWNLTTLAYMKIKFGKTTGYFPILAN